MQTAKDLPFSEKYDWRAGSDEEGNLPATRSKAVKPTLRLTYIVPVAYFFLFSDPRPVEEETVSRKKPWKKQGRLSAIARLF